MDDNDSSHNQDNAKVGKLLPTEPISFLVSLSLYLLLGVPPREQPVEPRYGDAEPTVFGDRLAAKAEDKVAERIALEREAHVEKTDVGISILVGVANGLPYSHRVGVQGGVALAFRGQIPQVSVALGIGAGTSTHQLVLVERDKDARIVALVELFKLLDFGDDAPYSHPVKPIEQFVEGFQFFFVGNLSRFQSTLGRLFDSASRFFGQPLHRGERMERIVYLLPMYGKIMVVAKLPVAEHLLRDVAELDK